MIYKIEVGIYYNIHSKYKTLYYYLVHLPEYTV